MIVGIPIHFKETPKIQCTNVFVVDRTLNIHIMLGIKIIKKLK